MVFQAPPQRLTEEDLQMIWTTIGRHTESRLNLPDIYRLMARNAVDDGWTHCLCDEPSCQFDQAIRTEVISRLAEYKQLRRQTSPSLTQADVYHAVRGALMDDDVQLQLCTVTAAAGRRIMDNPKTQDTLADAILQALESRAGKHALAEAVATGYLMARRAEHEHALTTRLWRVSVNILRIAVLPFVLFARALDAVVTALVSILWGMIAWELIDAQINTSLRIDTLQDKLNQLAIGGRRANTKTKSDFMRELRWDLRLAWYIGYWTRRHAYPWISDGLRIIWHRLLRLVPIRVRVSSTLRYARVTEAIRTFWTTALAWFRPNKKK